MSKHFCIYPFVSLETRNSGDVGICCRSAAVGDINTQRILEIWNSDRVKKLRLDIMAGVKNPDCAGCWYHEDAGIESKRTRNNDLTNPDSEYSKFFGQEQLMLSDGTMPIPPQHVGFRVNNLCNLKCRMCNPLDSTSWDDWGTVKTIVEKYTPKTTKLIAELDLENKPLLNRYRDTFYSDILEIIPWLKKVDFSGGEPLTNPDHYRILDMMYRAGDIELKYDTNFLNLRFKNRDIMEIWSHFKRIQLNISVDGIGEVYNYVRSNGSFTVLKSNLDLISSCQNITQLVISSATSIYNVEDMINVTRLAASYNAPHHMCKVSFPNFLSCQILPDNEKEMLINKLSDFISIIPSLYTDQRISRYVVSQYRDLITFITVSKYTPELVRDFVEYDSRLNMSRSAVSIPIVNRMKEYVRNL